MANPDGVEGKGREGSSGRVYQVIGTKTGVEGIQSWSSRLIWHSNYYMEETRTSSVSPLPHYTQHADIHTHGSETRQEWERLTAETVAVAVTSY